MHQREYNKQFVEGEDIKNQNRGGYHPVTLAHKGQRASSGKHPSLVLPQ